METTGSVEAHTLAGAEAEDGVLQGSIWAVRSVWSSWIPLRACHWIVTVWSGWCAVLSPMDYCHQKAGSQRIKLSGSMQTCRV